MNLILEALTGPALHLRDRDKPAYQTPELAPAATMEIRLADVADPYNSTSVGTVIPGQPLSFDFNPDTDRHLIFWGIPSSVDGKRDISQIRDAIKGELVMQRETVAPLIGQSGPPVNLPGDNYSIPIGVAGFTRHARFRKVEASATNDFPPESTQVTLFDSEDFSNKQLPLFLDLASVVLPLTPQLRFIRISHSGGQVFGPPSDPIEITYPDTAGSGGSSGDFDPITRDELEIILP